jgi:hypothetical protein
MSDPALAAASKAEDALAVASTALGRLYLGHSHPSHHHTTTTTHATNPSHTTTAVAGGNSTHTSNLAVTNNTNTTPSASIDVNATVPPLPFPPSHHHHHHHHHHTLTHVTDLTSIVRLARHCEEAYAIFDAHFTR